MRGDAFSAGIVAGFEQPVPVSNQRIEIRVGLEVDGDCRIGAGALKKSNLKRVTVDTAVQEKAMTCPMNAKLLNLGSRVSDEESSISWFDASPKLCSSRSEATFEGEALCARSSDQADEGGGEEIAHNLVQGVVHDVERKAGKIANPCVQQLAGSHLESELELAKRVMTQERNRKNKVYSAHAPEVECISKGKVHKRYEFGVKVGIAVTNRSNFVLSGLAFPGNPYDGHTLSA